MLHRQQSAVGYYRTWVPARFLKESGKYDITYWEEATFKRMMKPNPKQFVLDHKDKFDLIMVDRCLEWEPMGFFGGIRHFNAGCKMVVDFDDDFSDVPWWNPAHGKYQAGQQFYDVGMSHLKMSEMCTVSTAPLRKKFAERTHAIMTAQNCIDPKDWTGLPVNPDRANDPAVRVLYGGANGHYGDLDAVRAGLEAVIRKPPVPWRLICFGAIPGWLHQASRDYPQTVISLPWANFKHYPATVAWGGFDASIAPLADHPFNESKSNIKWLEAGIQGIPFMCSDVGPYKDIPSDCALKVENTAAQWVTGFHTMLKDSYIRNKMKELSFQAVQDEWTVAARGKIWHDVVEASLARPRIESLEGTRLPSEIARAASVNPPSPEGEAQVSP
jgi:hypothetical protein